jgi:hypothetical protein
MKASYWIVIIIVTSAIAFAKGRVTGQQLTLKSDEVVDSKNTSNHRESSLDTTNTLNVQSDTADELSSNSTHSFPSLTKDIVVELGDLLVKIEENPNQTSFVIKLVAMLEALSTEELLALAPLLENSSESQRNKLNQIIIAQLVEKAPDKALAYAQRYNPMPDSPYYLAAIKAQIAEKRPELGFEYLNQMLELAHEDIDLSANSTLLKALAKADLTQLVDTLGKFQDIGVNLENSLNSISYGLETSAEHLNLFNELRRLDDMSILSSVLIDWVKISPAAVFERLNQIAEIAEREK